MGAIETTVRSRYLGSVVAQVMRDRDLLQEHAAETLGWSRSKVCNLIAGKRGTSRTDVATILALCGTVQGPVRDMLLEIADNTPDQTWIQEHGEFLPAELPVLREVEKDMTRVVCFDADLVPALVQTEEYARGFYQANPLVSDDEIDRRATVRRARQRIVDWRGSWVRTFTFFVSARALSHRFVARDALCEQVHHLLRLAVRSRVDIRVVPDEVLLPPMGSSFQLMYLGDGVNPVVYLEGTVVPRSLIM